MRIAEWKNIAGKKTREWGDRGDNEEHEEIGG